MKIIYLLLLLCHSGRVLAQSNLDTLCVINKHYKGTVVLEDSVSTVHNGLFFMNVKNKTGVSGIVVIVYKKSKAYYLVENGFAKTCMYEENNLKTEEWFFNDNYFSTKTKDNKIIEVNTVERIDGDLYYYDLKITKNAYKFKSSYVENGKF